ncbi:MAG TPA: MOSC domain-containing protein [Polyangiaceae bacterium]
MGQVTTAELLEAIPGRLDTDSLAFTGLRGDRTRHLNRTALEAAVAGLPHPPKDEGMVELLVARGPNGERELPQAAVLTAEGGMPGDRWATEKRYGPEFQLATTRADFARLVANGQPLELHGDNLYLTLDLSSENLPAGSRLRLGQALVQVTPQPHNGCKKWVQRFGLDAMQLNLAPTHRHLHLRGIYLQVIEAGRASVGDRVVVVSRATL